MNILDRIKFKYLKYRYNKARKIYIVCCWARWGVLQARFSGKFNEKNQPLTIQYSDHNGTHESYYIAPWYLETTGLTIAYFFNEKDAEYLANSLDKITRCEKWKETT